MKRIADMLLIILIMFLAFPNVVIAETNCETVYASKSVQDAVYRATQQETFDYYKWFKKDRIEIVKESITRVYSVDILEYAETGVLAIKPDVSRVSPSKEDEIYGNVYVAKLVTASGDFAGNIQFYVEDGIAYGLLFTPSAAYMPETVRLYHSSCSYVDHEKRIRNLLDRETFVSASDVKYVYIGDVGACFVVQNESEYTIIPVGYDNVSSEAKIDYILTTAELKEIAEENLKKHNEFLLEKAKWEAEHPGETYLVFGTEATSPIVTGCGEVQNILNIVEYLNTNDVQYESNGTGDTNNIGNFISDTSESFAESVVSDNLSISNESEPIQESNAKAGMWIAIACGAMLLVGIVLVVLRKNKVN